MCLSTIIMKYYGGKTVKFQRSDTHRLKFLMTSGFVKRAPELHDPEDNVENVSHKVKMLESVVINLANKISEETRILKEDSKAIRSEIKSPKPSFADLFKNQDAGKAKLVENTRGTADRRDSKRSRVDDNHDAPEPMVTRDEVFHQEFQTQQKRGFLNGGGRDGQQGGGGRHAGGQAGENGAPRDRT